MTDKDCLSNPIDILLFCPSCGEQHIDQPQPEKEWANPPHKSHECQFCSYVWRPSDVPTNGVLTIQTKGQVDRSARPRPFAAGPVAAVLEELKQREGDDRYHVHFRNGLASARQRILSAIRHSPNPLQPDLLPMTIVGVNSGTQMLRRNNELVLSALAAIGLIDTVALGLRGLTDDAMAINRARLLLLQYGLIYEDELPATMAAPEYDKWFALSKVIGGVRMGPPIEE